MMWPPIPPLTPVEMRMGGSPSSGIRLRELPTGLPTGATGLWAAWGGGGMDVKTLSRGVNREWQGTNWCTKLGSEDFFLFAITTVMLQ